MPELPEVETIVRKLRRIVVGKTVSEIRLSGLPLRRPMEKSFAGVLRGRRISGILRRGKYIVVRLEPHAFWLIHLGMSGRVLYRPGAATVTRHTHAVIRFSDGSALEYNDPRRFGLLAAHEARSLRELPELTSLGRDPLGPGFSSVWLLSALRATRRDVKAFLLDQNMIAGLGNIYVCEALFHARIHPARICNRISGEEAELLVRAVRKVLRRAIANHGTTFSDFAASDGEPGANQRYLRVFQREGLRCRRCRGMISRLRQGNRSSYYCPGCQH